MPVETSRGRGRPRGKHRSSADFSIIQYLALISMKHGINSERLFDSIVEAWKYQESMCESLLIECRLKTRDNAIFLITKSSKVGAQFSIPTHILEESSQFKKLVLTRASRKTTPSRIEAKHLRIGDLKYGMKRISLEARILEIPKPRSVLTRLGNFATVTNARISDETGSILLSLWNEQIDEVSVGDTIRIENARVAAFRGERQLRVGRRGKLSVIVRE